MYGNEDTPGNAAADLEAGAEAPAEGAPAEGGAIQIPSQYLPPGIKEGDTLRCTAMSEDGCTFEHEAAGGDGSEGEAWEQDFRKEMSPQQPQSQAE